jgi:hypothetical protein
MPHLTEHQEDANTLLNAFIVHLLAQMEADDSEPDSEAGTSDGEDSEDYSSDDPITKGIIKSLEATRIGMRDHGATSQRPRKISAYFSTIITRTSPISFVPTLVSHRGALMTLSILSRTTPSFITIQTIHKCLSRNRLQLLFTEYKIIRQKRKK